MIIYKKIFTFLLLLCSIAAISGCSIIQQSQKIKALNKILKSGNEALTAKQYDKAIEFYDSGLSLVPKEPVLLSNKSIAVRSRGVERYNA